MFSEKIATFYKNPRDFLSKYRIGKILDGTQCSGLNWKAYIIEGGVEYVFYPPHLSDLICKIVRPIFWKKCPPQAKKFWGPFFQKIDVFRKI